MSVAVYITLFCVLISGYTQGVAAKEDGVPDRRVGGGTRMEIPGKLSRVSHQSTDRHSLNKKTAEGEAEIIRSVRF